MVSDCLGPRGVQTEVGEHQGQQCCRGLGEGFDGLALVTDPHALVVPFHELVREATLFPIPSPRFKGSVPAAADQVPCLESSVARQSVAKLICVRKAPLQEALTLAQISVTSDVRANLLNT